MNTFVFLVVLVQIICLIFVKADFYTLVAENCDALQSPAKEFDTLFSCATYVARHGDLFCLSKEMTDGALQTVPDWKYNGVDTISRTFTFADFQTAFYFMTQSAQIAEKNQHHPDWSNLYNTVAVKLTTDDKGCLSSFDIALASSMDVVAKPLLALNNNATVTH